MKNIKSLIKKCTLIVSMSVMSFVANAAEPLKIGYSDWPGWVAWEVAIEKDWFKEEGVDVEFEWFDYVASMDAFAAGKLDAVGMTNGDALVIGSSGAKGIIILATDYSFGNDMIIAKPGISSVKELKGKKIGVEVGYVSHLMLLDALEKAGMSESDVELINVPTNETPQVLASGDVDAIVAWQPSSGQALTAVPGSKAVATSKDAPGLIYDTYVVSPSSYATRKAEWEKVVKVWYRVVDFVNDPKTRPEALSIMSARAGLSPEAYEPMLMGAKILSLAESKEAFKKTAELTSIYGSSEVANEFNLKYGVYTESQSVDKYIDPSITLGL
ncbi:ABC transporter substrate-binding protein [Psychromonas arctica]|uniref:ABC transporter substrate-binding protein n=1 Tax=Psychromonas arctica TaxID=168275 RepID=UPI002FD2899D